MIFTVYLFPEFLRLALIAGRLGNIFEVDMLMEWCQKFKLEVEAAVVAQCKQVKTTQRKAKQ
jgi:hypothetical protein